MLRESHLDEAQTLLATSVARIQDLEKHRYPGSRESFAEFVTLKTLCPHSGFVGQQTHNEKVQGGEIKRQEGHCEEVSIP